MSGLAASRARQKAKQTPFDTIEANPLLLYSYRNIWSISYPQWKLYEVKLPRLPTIEDNFEKNRWVENFELSPKDFNQFIGNTYSECFTFINKILETFYSTKNLPEILFISGPSGSGKSLIGKIFCNKLIDNLNLTLNQASRWCLYLNANDHDIVSIRNRIQSFIEPPFEKYLTVNFRIILIDNFQSISASGQQQLKQLLMDPNIGNKIRFLFVCPEPKHSTIAFLLSKGVIIKTKKLSEKDTLEIILRFLFDQKIGYNLDGISTLFFVHNNLALSKLIDSIQNIFLLYQYVSKENVIRYINRKNSPINLSSTSNTAPASSTATSSNSTSSSSLSLSLLPSISQTRSLEPLPRCHICTLIPPCKHFPLEKLEELGLQRRKELPKQKAGSMVCPEFQRFGYCSVYNRIRKCNLHHPLNIHIVSPSVKRCSQCTIPWPCNHCAYNATRNNLINLISDIQARFVKLRQLNSMTPPLALTRFLVSLFLLLFFSFSISFYNVI